MKQFAVLVALIAVCLGADEEAAAPAPLTYTLPYAAGLPLTYSNYAGIPYTYANTIAAAPAVATVAAAPAAVTYNVAPTIAAAPVATVAAAAPAVAAPVTYANTIAAAPAVAAPLTYAAAYAPGSQFHAQDEFGNLNYGYSNLHAAKQEIGNTYGGVSGSYSYVDADNKLQTVNYIADAAGFRVADSRLPVAPVYDGVAPTFNPEPLVAPVFDGVAPEPVQDTPEVAEARAAHLAAVEAAKADRKRRDADPAILAASTRILTAPTPLIHNAPLVAPALTYAGAYGYPYNYGLGYAAGYHYGSYLL